MNDQQDISLNDADGVPSLFTVLIDSIFSENVSRVIEYARRNLESNA